MVLRGYGCGVAILAAAYVAQWLERYGSRGFDSHPASLHWDQQEEHYMPRIQIPSSEASRVTTGGKVMYVS